MNIDAKREAEALTLTLEGRLDTSTAPALSEKLGVLEGVKTLIFDLEKLDYISSAGLRVLLSSQKTMNEQGQMVVRHAGKAVMEVFDTCNFTSILTIEN